MALGWDTARPTHARASPQLCRGVPGRDEAGGDVGQAMPWGPWQCWFGGVPSLDPVQGSGCLIRGAAELMAGPQKQEGLAGMGKAGPWLHPRWGRAEVLPSHPKGWEHGEVLAAAQRPGDGHPSRARRGQQEGGRASHPSHVPEGVMCGRPLDFSHTFQARTHQTKAFPGYSCFCLKG